MSTSFEEVDVDQLDLTEPTKAKSRLSRLRRAPAKKQPQVTSPQGKGVQVTEQSTEEATQLQHKPHPAPLSLPAGSGLPAHGQSGGTQGSPSSAEADAAERQSNEDLEHWDEEDELEEDAQRAVRSQNNRSSASGPASDSSSESSQATGSQKSSDDGSSSGDSQALYAGMQAALQDDVPEDRIGYGRTAEIQPMSIVLQKLLQRRQAATMRQVTCSDLSTGPNRLPISLTALSATSPGVPAASIANAALAYQSLTQTCVRWWPNRAGLSILSTAMYAMVAHQAPSNESCLSSPAAVAVHGRAARPQMAAPAPVSTGRQPAQPETSQGSQDLVLLSDEDEGPPAAAPAGNAQRAAPDFSGTSSALHPWEQQIDLPTAPPDTGPADGQHAPAEDLAARASQPAGAFGGESLLLGPSLHLGLDSETQGWLGSQTYPPPEGPPENLDQTRPDVPVSDAAMHSGQAGADAPPEAAGPSPVSLAARELPMQHHQQAAPPEAQTDTHLQQPHEQDRAEEEGEEDEEEEAAEQQEHDGSEQEQEERSSAGGSEALEEEEEASDSGSDSEASSESEELGEEARKAAVKQALRDARAALRDRPRKKARSSFFDEEAELSEDEDGRQHADSDDDESGDDRDHRALLAELIGHEKDGKRDEGKRAKLHAQWQEAQDDEAVQHLLKGVQHGFRSRHRHAGALDGEDGNNYNARLRRLAMAQRQREGSDAEGSSEQSGSSNGSDEDDSQPMDMDAIEQMSDDEAKAELKTYHQQQLREAAHKEAAHELQLLDGDAMRVLGMFASAAQQKAPTEQAQPPAMRQLHPPSGAFAVDLTNRARILQSKRGSFVGLSSEVTATGASRSAWQHSNARSYIFGSATDSNAAPAAEQEQEQQHSQAPTSFAGLRQMVKGSGARGAASSQGLLDLLGGSADIGPVGFDHSSDRPLDLPMPGILAPSKARSARCRA